MYLLRPWSIIHPLDCHNNSSIYCNLDGVMANTGEILNKKKKCNTISVRVFIFCMYLNVFFQLKQTLSRLSKLISATCLSVKAREQRNSSPNCKKINYFRDTMMYKNDEKKKKAQKVLQYQRNIQEPFYPQVYPFVMKSAHQLRFIWNLLRRSYGKHIILPQTLQKYVICNTKIFPYIRFYRKYSKKMCQFSGYSFFHMWATLQISPIKFSHVSSIAITGFF